MHLSSMAGGESGWETTKAPKPKKKMGKKE